VGRRDLFARGKAMLSEEGSDAMPMRRAIGICLACLVTSACAIGETPETAKTAEDSTSHYPGEASGNPRQDPDPSIRGVGRSQFGKAAWYNHVGRPTASGEILDTVTATAAHRSLPLASFAKVTNLDNGRSVVVKINDRGPFTRGRILDLSPRAADVLDMKRAGVVAVVVEPLVNETASATLAMF
jgi:rare lipoprotein A